MRATCPWLVLLLAACGVPSAEPVDDFDVGELGEAVTPVECPFGLQGACTTGGTVFSAAVRVGASTTGQGDAAQTFTPTQSGVVNTVSLRLRLLRALPEGTHSLRVELHAVAAATGVESTGLLATGSLALTAAVGQGEALVELRDTHGAQVSLTGGAPYALVLVASRPASGTILLGVAAHASDALANAGAFRRGRRGAANEPEFPATAYRAVGTSDLSFRLNYGDLAQIVSECGQILTAPGAYSVVHDLDCGDGLGIAVETSNVVLHLGGWTISTTGNALRIGGAAPINHVAVLGPAHVTGSANSSILVGDVSNLEVNAVIMTGNRVGLATVGPPTASHNRFVGNELFGNDEGFQLLGGSDDEVTLNFVHHNISRGILVGFDPVSQASAGAYVHDNNSSDNSQGGIEVGPGGTGARILRNVTLRNGLDLLDDKPGCTSDTWSDNTFTTASPTDCVH